MCSVSEHPSHRVNKHSTNSIWAAYYMYVRLKFTRHVLCDKDNRGCSCCKAFQIYFTAKSEDSIESEGFLGCINSDTCKLNEMMVYVPHTLHMIRGIEWT